MTRNPPSLFVDTNPHLVEWQKSQQIVLPDIGVTIKSAQISHLNQIVSLVQGEAALVGVSDTLKAQATISDFINNTLALVALDNSGQVVSFQGLGLWPSIQMCELRSAKTSNEYTGKGLNTLMKQVMIFLAKDKYPNWNFVGFTEAASKSRGILQKLGFTEIPMNEVRTNLSVLGEGCPSSTELADGPTGCFLRCGGNCGCKVYQLKN